METIRIMTLEDVPSVARLEKETFSDPWSENVYRQTLELPGVIYLVVQDEEGNIIGASGIRNIVGEGEITNVMIAPGYRQKGLANRMLNELILQGRNMGIADITLEVRQSNAPAIHLYEKLGFVSEGVRPGFYDNPKEDAVIMWMRA